MLNISYGFRFHFIFCSKLYSAYKIFIKLLLKRIKNILHLFVPRKRRYEVEETSILNYLSIVTVITYMYRLHQTPDVLPSAHILY
jgi:hypothetical protein